MYELVKVIRWSHMDIDMQESVFLLFRLEHRYQRKARGVVAWSIGIGSRVGTWKERPRKQ